MPNDLFLDWTDADMYADDIIGFTDSLKLPTDQAIASLLLSARLLAQEMSDTTEVIEEMVKYLENEL